MIHFHKLVINNFLSFGEKQVLHLNRQGVVHIEGKNLDDPYQDSNRAGKSAILEAILWALFGKTVRGLRHDSVVNRFAKRDCYVSVHFSVDDVGYKVARYRRHRSKKNKLGLWCGDKLISFRHEAETQSKLENILKINFHTFTNSIFFGGLRPFALLTDKEQKEVLESFLHFERIDNALDRTRLERIRAEEKLDSVQGGISVETLKVGILKERIKALGKSVKIFKGERKQRLDAVALDMKSLFTRTPFRTVKSLEQEHEAAVQEKERFIRKHSSKKQKVLDLRKKIRRLEVLLRSRKSLLSERCPVCGRIVTEKTLSGLLKHIKRDLKDLHKQLRIAKGRFSQLERRLHYASDVESRLSKKLRSSRIREQEELKREQKRKLLFREVRRLKASCSPFTHELESSEAECALHISRLFVLEYEESLLQRRIRDLSFWEEGFGNAGLKALIVREALPPMNEKLAEYTNEIFGGGVELQFVPSKKTKKGEERELFHIHYASRKGSNSYLGESSGGRRRVDICVLLTFAWMSRASNLLLLDELLDGLDFSGRQAVLKILATLRGTVLVISHRKDVEKVGKILTVVKKNGISTLEKVA